MEKSKSQSQGQPGVQTVGTLRGVLGTFNSSSLDVRLYLQVFKRRKWWFLFPCVTFLGVGIIAASFLEPYYEASTTILIGRPRYLSPAVRGAESPVSLVGGADVIRSQVLSRENLRQLIDVVGLKDDEELRLYATRLSKELPDLTLEEIKERLLIERLRKRVLRVRAVRGNVVQITARAPTAQTAYVFARTMAQVFIDQNLKTELSGIRSAFTFSEEQLEIYKQRLEEAEDRLRRFERGQLRIRQRDTGDRRQTIEEISAALSRLETDLAEKRNHLGYLENGAGGMLTGTKLLESPSLTGLKAMLFEKMMKVPEYMLKYSWRDAAFIRFNDEVLKLKSEIRSEIERIVQSSNGSDSSGQSEMMVDYAITSLEIQAQKRQKEAFSKLLAVYERATGAVEREVERTFLQQEVAVNREIYNMFLQQSRNYQIQEALQRKEAEAKYRILEPTQKPLKPAGPGRRKFVAIFGMLGLGLGVASVYFLELTDSTFKTAEAIQEYLSLPVLGTIPLMVDIRPRRSIKKLIIAGGVMVGMWIMTLSFYLLNLGRFFYF